MAVKKGWNPLSGKDGWFEELKQRIMVNCILRDDPSKFGLNGHSTVYTSATHMRTLS
jgi:hypothetical protein